MALSFWRTRKAPRIGDPPIIASIQGEHDNPGNGVAVVFLVLGVFAMLLIIVSGANAIQLAAWG